MTTTALLNSLINYCSPFSRHDESNNVNRASLPDQHKTPQHSRGSKPGCHQTVTQRRGTDALQTPMTQDQKEYMKKRPLKYVGYPLFTKFLASSQDLVLLRRFDQLHARVLLGMQDEIVQKEEQIASIDQLLSVIDTPQDIEHINGSFRKDLDRHPNAQYLPAKVEQRSRLLQGLRKDLRHYDSMVLNYRKLRSDPEPSKHNIKTVQQYLKNRGHSTTPGKENRGPLLQSEAQYIYEESDLLQLVPETKAPLRNWIEKWTWFMLGRWFRKYPRGGRNYSDFVHENEVVYQSNARIDGFITTLSLAIGLLLLIGPLELLNLLDDASTKLHVICGLIALFLFMMGSLMPARPWETLAATAAYSAVLMVFMQIDHSRNSSSS